LVWCGYLFELSEKPFGQDAAAGDASASSGKEALPELGRGDEILDDTTVQGPTRFLRVTRQSSMVKSAAKN
jgi:hypothetical protein